MFIYFSEITYNGSPVLWVCEADLNHAYCLYLLLENPNIEIDRHLIDSHIADIKGIQTEGLEEAYIGDVKDFQYTQQNVIKAGSNMNFFKQPELQAAHSAAVLRHAEFMRLMRFNTLLEQVAGGTLTYEHNRISKKNIQRLNDLASLPVFTSASVDLAVQGIKNVPYYYLRQIQMQLIRKLYEQHLFPALKTYRVLEDKPGGIPAYFREAIRAIMDNEFFNAKDTPCEIEAKTSGQEISIKDNFAIRDFYATRMMRRLTYLVDDSSESPVEDRPAFNAWIKGYRQYISDQKEAIRGLLNEIQLLVVCTGLLDYSFRSIPYSAFLCNNKLTLDLFIQSVANSHNSKTTLGYALQKLPAHYQNPTVLPKFESKTSLYAILERWLEVVSPVSKEEGEKIICDVIKKVISALVEKQSRQMQQILGIINQATQSIYLPESYCIDLASKFAQFSYINDTGKKSIMNREKPIEKWKSQAISAVVHYINEQIDNLSEKSMHEASCSNAC